MVKGPIVIEKSKNEYAEDDYKWISKNFKAINILYCAITIDVYEFISHYDSAKEIFVPFATHSSLMKISFYKTLWGQIFLT